MTANWWGDWVQLADSAGTTLLFWMLFRTLRHRRRSNRVLVGFVLLGLAYVLASSFGLTMSSDALLALLVICGVVATLTLQDDVRRGLETLAFGRRPRVSDSVKDILVRATFRMAEQKVGASILLPGDAPITQTVSQGVRVDALISEPLLLSLFDPGSPGHDGALLIRGDRVECFAVHLPLSENEALLEGRGTRHASALGISEQTDALCVVVSEERGQVSVARHGQLKTVDEAALRAEIKRHLSSPRERVPRTPTLLRRRVLEVALAVLATGVSWFALFPGGVVVTRQIEVPIRLENLPEGVELEKPISVTVTLSLPRRSLLLANPTKIEVALDAWLAGAGKRVFVISRGDVSAPLGMEVLDVYPRRVQAVLRRVR